MESKISEVAFRNYIFTQFDEKFPELLTVYGRYYKLRLVYFLPHFHCGLYFRVLYNAE